MRAGVCALHQLTASPAKAYRYTVGESFELRCPLDRSISIAGEPKRVFVTVHSFSASSTIDAASRSSISPPKRTASSMSRSRLGGSAAFVPVAVTSMDVAGPPRSVSTARQLSARQPDAPINRCSTGDIGAARSPPANSVSLRRKNESAALPFETARMDQLFFPAMCRCWAPAGAGVKVESVIKLCNFVIGDSRGGFLGCMAGFNRPKKRGLF